MTTEAFTEFQVAEYYDAQQNKLWKVQLEYRKIIKDINGSVYYTGPWMKVNRVRINATENSI